MFSDATAVRTQKNQQASAVVGTMRTQAGWHTRCRLPIVALDVNRRTHVQRRGGGGSPLRAALRRAETPPAEGDALGVDPPQHHPIGVRHVSTGRLSILLPGKTNSRADHPFPLMAGEQWKEGWKQQFPCVLFYGQKINQKFSQRERSSHRDIRPFLLSLRQVCRPNQVMCLPTHVREQGRCGCRPEPCPKDPALRALQAGTNLPEWDTYIEYHNE